MKALITGASSGIGKEIARVLSEAGHDVILVGRNTERLEQTRKMMKHGAETVTADLSDENHVRALYERTRGIDILINNAGFGTVGDFIQTSADTETEMIRTNVIAPHLLMKYHYADMQERGSGYILNVVSSAGFMPCGPYFSTYYATKAYMLSLTRAIASESEKSSVYIGALCPGPVKTNFDKRAGVKKPLKGLDCGYVARYAVKKMFKKKKMIIPGADIGLLKIATKLVPDSLMIKLTKRQQLKKFG